MRVAARVRWTRIAAWTATGAAWLGLVVAGTALTVEGRLASLVVGQAVLFCTVLTALAVVLSCIPDEQSIASAAWLAGWKAAHDGVSPADLRAVR